MFTVQSAVVKQKGNLPAPGPDAPPDAWPPVDVVCVCLLAKFILFLQTKFV
jgi:hypothetical protein